MMFTFGLTDLVTPNRLQILNVELWIECNTRGKHNHDSTV